MTPWCFCYATPEKQALAEVSKFAALSPAPAGVNEELLEADDVRERVAAQVKECSTEGVGFWRSCTGCYETEDGQNVHGYPHSKAFGCTLGSGCHECGGIGAVWDTTDYADMAESILRASSLPESNEPEGGDALDVLKAHTNWSLDWGEALWGDEESEHGWRVVRVNGGRNDREWTIIGFGNTPKEALASALIPAAGGAS